MTVHNAEYYSAEYQYSKCRGAEFEPQLQYTDTSPTNIRFGYRHLQYRNALAYRVQTLCEFLQDWLLACDGRDDN